MGFLSGIGKAIHSPDFGMRLQAALATAAGDPNAVYRMHEMQRQNAELALRQQAAQRAEDDSNAQMVGLSQAGFDKPSILALGTPEARAQAMAARLAPHQFDSHGGSLGTPDSHGLMTYQQAPWRETFGTDMLQSNGTAPPQAIASRVEGVPVTGMGLYGVDNRGIVNPGQAPRPFYPGTGAPPPAAPTQSADAWPTPTLDPTRPELDATNAPQRLPRPPGPPASAPRYGDPVRELTQMLGVPPSSGFRTQAHQDSLVQQGLTNTRHSQHTARNAIDFPIPAGPAQQAAAAQIRQRYPQAQFAFEGTNLHVTLPGWGHAPDLTGSARRYPGGARAGGVVTAQGPQGQTYYQVNGQWYDNPEGR